MSRSRYKIYETHYPYFLTLTVNNWIPIFTRPITTEILLEALQYRQQHCALRIYAYVILENHMHLIAQSEQLNQQIAQFKSWTARQMLVASSNDIGWLKKLKLSLLECVNWKVKDAKRWSIFIITHFT
jgi:REP element-mobilizing transposase RayT